MKTNDIVLLVVLGVLGYVVISRLSPPPTGTSLLANPTGGTQPTTQAQDPTAAIANAIGSFFQTVGSFAQSSPKTT